MLLEKQIMEQHLQETAGDLEFAERELSRRGSPTGTPPREDSEDGSPRQQTPSLRQVYADDPAHLKEENERIMEVAVQSRVMHRKEKTVPFGDKSPVLQRAAQSCHAYWVLAVSWCAKQFSWIWTRA